MKPDDETIENFRKVYFEEFGDEISRDEAHEKFLRLVNFVRVILRPGLPRKPDEFDQPPENAKLRNHP